MAKKLDSTTELIIQAIGKLENKLDGHEQLLRDNLITINGRLVKVEGDVKWSVRWVAGLAGLIVTACGTMVTWLFNRTI